VRIEVNRRRMPGIRLAPLIDVVFILLVFFMLASSFLDWRAFEIAMPAADSAPSDSEDPIIVSLAADGRVTVGGEEVPAHGVAERVQALLAAAGEERPVLLRTDGDAPLGRAVELFDRLQAGGIDGVSLSAQQP